MSVFADLGIGLHRYLTKNKPKYIIGSPAPTDVNLLDDDQDLSVSKISYPSYKFDKIKWNSGKDWIEISFKDGSSKTYTIESTGKRDIINMIRFAIKGTGLKQYIDENKPISVEETSPETTAK